MPLEPLRNITTQNITEQLGIFTTFLDLVPMRLFFAKDSVDKFAAFTAKQAEGAKVQLTGMHWKGLCSIHWINTIKQTHKHYAYTII